MDIREFNGLECVSCLTKLVNPKVGDRFLTGNRMINQKEKKVVGNEISWYEVIAVRENGQVSYTPRYGKMKKIKMEESK